MTRKVLFEAHADFNSMMFHMRTIFEMVAGKCDGRMEFSTWCDDTAGSTGKGTSRNWIEEALGSYTGTGQRGYTSIITQGTLCFQKGKGDANSEKMANLEGCLFTFCDDSKANFKAPLDNNMLKSIAGRSKVANSRKYAGDRSYM